MTAHPNVPKDDACARHRRYTGSQKWKLSSIISAIPILIHLALFLFLAGLDIQLWTDNNSVAKAASIPAGAATFLTVVGGALPVVLDYCPLNTPLSHVFLYVAATVNSALGAAPKLWRTLITSTLLLAPTLGGLISTWSRGPSGNHVFCRIPTWFTSYSLPSGPFAFCR
jgi:hypothetical protein